MARITDADSADNQNDVVRTIHTDTGLDAETERTYRVRAQNEPALGTMDVSEESEHAEATTDAAMAPGAPMAVTGMATSDTEITVTWGSPASDGGADITGYMVQRAYMGADNMMSEWMDVDPAHMGMDMMYMDTGLMPETAYYYRVAAMNSVGMGEYSDGMTMATTEATDTAPGVPTAVTAMETSDTEITVTWGSPASDGGADITGYMVQRAYMGADNMMSEWMDVDPVHMGMDMEYMDTGLMPETTYYYRVAAMNSAGMGEYSDGMAMAATEAANTAPTAGAAIADQTVMVDATVMVQSTITDADTDDTLTWSAMSNMPTYATAEVDNMGMVTITGVAEGMATITVTATDMADATATQAIMVTVEAVDTTPMAPTSVMATADDSDPGDLMITVTWTDGENVEAYGVVLFKLGLQPNGLTSPGV